MGEFILAYGRDPSSEPSMHPTEGEARFTMMTSLGEVKASVILRQNIIIWATLSFRELRPNGQLRMIRRETVIRNSLSGMGPLPDRRFSEDSRLGELEEWFSKENALEGIYYARLFMREFKALVEEIEQGPPIGKMDILAPEAFDPLALEA